MWFDPYQASAIIEGAALAPSHRREDESPPAPVTPCRHVAQVARRHPLAREITPCASDPDCLLALLQTAGPMPYGAAASSLGWGATRAWQAEGKLRTSGRVRIIEFGRAEPSFTGEIA